MKKKEFMIGIHWENYSWNSSGFCFILLNSLYEIFTVFDLKGIAVECKGSTIEILSFSSSRLHLFKSKAKKRKPNITIFRHLDTHASHFVHCRRINNSIKCIRMNEAIVCDSKPSSMCRLVTAVKKNILQFKRCPPHNKVSINLQKMELSYQICRKN